MSATECAVVGCVETGKPHRCVGDGTYHGHGLVHYDCARVESANHGLTFKGDTWRPLCDAHYGQIYEAMKTAGVLPTMGRR